MVSSDNRASELVAVTVTFVSLALSSALLRLYTRLRLLKWIGVDDILLFIATGAALAEALGNVIAAQYGLGGHVEEQLPEWRKPYAIATITSSLSYSVSAMFVKLSLLSFYLRLSKEPLFRSLTYVMIVISSAFGISSILAAAFQCVPISMLWDATQPGHCINVNAFYFANAGLHILTEVLIYALPVHTLWNLQLPFRQKLGLIGLMSIGAMLIVVSCYRIVTIRDLLASSDITWNIVTPLNWYTVELNLAIFIACGPAFLAFFRHYLPFVFGGSSSRSNYQVTGRKGSYPLRSFSKGAKSGVRTIITSNGKLPSRTGRELDNNNSSEELVIMMTKTETGNAEATRSEFGIKKKVDVWVDGEPLEIEHRTNLDIV